MKKRVIKIICVALSIVLICSFSPVALAHTNLETNGSTIESQMIQFVQDIFPVLFDRQGVNCQVSVGTQLNTYVIDQSGSMQVTDYQVYPLLCDEQLVGIVNITLDGNNIVGMDMGGEYATELDNALSSFTERFAIIYGDNGVYLKKETSLPICIMQYSGEMVQLECDVSEINYGTIEEYVRVPLQTTYRSARIGTQTIALPHVGNTSTNCCPDGICWAACIAMLSNYYCGTNYTALNIHNMFSCLTDDYHNEEKSMMRQLNLTVYGSYYSFGYSDVVNCIDNGRAMLLDLQSYGEGAHNVLANGYTYGTSGSTYVLYRDPNSNSQKSAMFPSTGNITISTGGTNYSVHCYMMVYG